MSTGLSKPRSRLFSPPGRRALPPGARLHGLIPLLCFLAFTATAATGLDEGLVLANIGEDEVRVADLLAGEPELAARLERGEPVLEEMESRLHVLVRERLFAREGARAGLAVSPPVRARLDRLLAEAYLAEQLERSAVSVTEDELRAHFEARPDDYVGPDRMRLAHILLGTAAEAQAVEAELEAGGDFAVLAMTRSLDRVSGVVGGDLGWLSAQELSPRLAWMVDGLDFNEVSRPIHTEFGYHLVVLREVAGALLSFEVARAAVERDVLQGKRAALAEALERELRETHRVRTSEEGMAALGAYIDARGVKARPAEPTPNSGGEDGRVPELRLIAARLGIGRVREARVTLPVPIANAGDATLWIDTLESDCPCVQALVNTPGIEPGVVEPLELIVYRDLVPSGETLATVHIRSNDPRGSVPLRLALEGQGAGDGESAPLFAEPLHLGEGRQWMTRALPVDVDGDGRTDLVATHRKPLKENSLHVWMQGADGRLHPASQNWISPGYSALASADLDGDGRLDLVAGSHFRKIVTYLSDGAGGFDHTIVATDDGVMDVVLADLDRDGDLELATIGWKDGGLDLYEADRPGAWRRVDRLMGEAPGTALAVGDANEDGDPDLFALAQRNQSALLLGDGAGGLAGAPLGFPSEVGAFSSIALGDVNGDGHFDVALNGGTGRRGEPNGPDVYLGNGNGEWRPSSEGLKTLYAAGMGVRFLDADGDGNLDLVAAGRIRVGTTSEDYGLYLYLGDGRGGWRLETESGLPGAGLSIPYGIAAGDLNGDDKLDLVVSHGYASDGKGGSISVWYHR